MSRSYTDYIAPALVAVAFCIAAAVFLFESSSFREAVEGWARRDLQARTERAAAAMREPLATGDFRKMREFSDACAAEGVRFTVFSAPGGLVLDSVSAADGFPDAIYARSRCGDGSVRLGLPLERVFAPIRRARTGLFLAAIMGGAGVFLVILFTYRQRVRLEEMRRTEAFRRDFIADVSHEIKTPLTGILGAVELLGEGKVQDMIRRESVRLNGLVQGILSLSRLERDGVKGAVVRAPADLSAVAAETVERLSTLAKGRGVSVELRAPDATPVSCDAVLVSQALANLLSNAILHSGSSEVVVSVSGGDGAAKISVEDHGKGIPAEERERVFERFRRLDASRSSDTGGAGLGLAIARRIFELHGGGLVLEPVSPSGCRFVSTIAQS